MFNFSLKEKQPDDIPADPKIILEQLKHDHKLFESEDQQVEEGDITDIFNNSAKIAEEEQEVIAEEKPLIDDKSDRDATVEQRLVADDEVGDGEVGEGEIGDGEKEKLVDSVIKKLVDSVESESAALSAPWPLEPDLDDAHLYQLPGEDVTFPIPRPLLNKVQNS